MGSTVSLPGVDLKKNGQTLLLVLDTGCPYCTASAAFYQELVRETQTVQLIAVLPQDVASSKKYLDDLGTRIDEIKQSRLETIGVKGTPTLILVNEKSEVVGSWPGKLSPEEERAVIADLH